MRRDMFDRLRGSVVKVDVGIGSGIWFGEGNPFLIERDRTDLVAGGVLVKQGRRETFHIHLEDVEKAGVASVRHIIEG